jgi:hypothetical protein
MRFRDYGRNQKKRKEDIYQRGFLLAGVVGARQIMIAYRGFGSGQVKHRVQKARVNIVPNAL